MFGGSWVITTPRSGPPCRIEIWSCRYDKWDWRLCGKSTPLADPVTVLDSPICDECAAALGSPNQDGTLD